MDEKDDDIEIDFGKIKNFFKPKDEKKDAHTQINAETHAAFDIKQKVQEEHPGSSDDEINIDFSKVKKIFKSDDSHKAEKHNSKEDDEISIDFGKIKNFFKPETGSNKASHDDINVDWGKFAAFCRKYGVIFLALIPIILSIYIRMQAGYLPITDEWAANSVISSIRSQVKSGIDQQYPNLPDANKNSLIDVQMQKTISQNKAQIDQQVAATSQYFKDFFQDSDGKNYMPDIDPYYWFRYVKNIVNHGYPGDEIRNGGEYDNHQVAPVGRPVPADRFHTYFLAYFYKALHIFVPGLTIMRSMFYYPVFVSAISVLLVFLIARDIGGNSAG